jgi:Beta-ketoacyl synthase, N-terminal domain
MKPVYLEAIGLAAPGLPNWNTSIPVLSGQQDYVSTPLDKYKPTQLPPNEARRATELVRMAFRVCENLMESTSQPMNQCANVFASSGGDYPIINQICRALCTPERLVSPTQFHNSVHNSAAGYWSIATGSRLPSCSLSAYDDSFCMGLLEAASLCDAEHLPTLLVVYDIKTPYPLNEKREIPVDFGVAVLLNPTRTDTSIAQLTMCLSGSDIAATQASSQLETLRLANPAARCLPLLEAIARTQSTQLVFSNQNNNSYLLELGLC